MFRLIYYLEVFLKNSKCEQKWSYCFFIYHPSDSFSILLCLELCLYEIHCSRCFQTDKTTTN